MFVADELDDSFCAWLSSCRWKKRMDGSACVGIRSPFSVSRVFTILVFVLRKRSGRKRLWPN
jgi:hypothetical protein